MQLEVFRRELDRLALNSVDKRSATLRGSYAQIISQLEDELREYDDSQSAS